jgi:hypothetical protein
VSPNFFDPYGVAPLIEWAVLDGGFIHGVLQYEGNQVIQAMDYVEDCDPFAVAMRIQGDICLSYAYHRGPVATDETGLPYRAFAK